MRSFFTFIAVVMFAVATSACRGPCTLIGCDNAVTVRVTDAAGAALSQFKGSVTIGGTPVAVECPSTNLECGEGQVRVRSNANRLPDTVEVALSTPDGQKSFDGTVSVGERVVTYPNGEDCDPGCESGSVAVVLQ